MACHARDAAKRRDASAKVKHIVLARVYIEKQKIGTVEWGKHVPFRL